jgi:hypothetical protein
MPRMAKHETIMLQEVDIGEKSCEFIPPPSRIAVSDPRFWNFGQQSPSILGPAHQYTPSTAATQMRAMGLDPPGSPRPPSLSADSTIEVLKVERFMREKRPIVCGIARAVFPWAPGHGFLIVWGITKPPGPECLALIPNNMVWRRITLTFRNGWWRDDSVANSWYTAVYPWTGILPGDADGDVMVEEMTDFWSVQAMLDRCCDEVLPLADASDLIHHPDGGCERTGTMRARLWKRTNVKVTITPVDFMGRRVMDIVATVTQYGEPSRSIQDQGSIDEESNGSIQAQ